MLQIIEQTVNRLVHDSQRFDKYREQLKELLEEIKHEFPTAKPIYKAEAKCSFFGVKELVEITIQNPEGVKLKGVSDSNLKQKLQRKKLQSQI